MSTESDQSEYQFVVAYTEDELRLLGKIIARRYAHDQVRASWVPLVFTPVGIGLAVLGLFQLGLFADAVVPTVLLTSFIAFFAGALGYYWVMRQSYQKRRLEDARRGTWSFYVDRAGIRYSGINSEGPIQWQAIDGVENLNSWVLFKFGLQALYIPSRVFADDAARATFVAAVAGRIKAAKAARP